MSRERKPLKRTGLKPPTPEQVLAWRQKPRHAIPKGKRPARVGRRGKREAAAWQLGRALVVERSGGFCEGPRLIGVHPTVKHSAAHVHHVRKRSLGGDHDPSNLLHVCWELHAWIHDESPNVDLKLRHDLGLLASAKLV